MISNNAIQPFPAGAETGVPHDDLIVGAGLVPAHDDVPAVGATLVVAQDNVPAHDNVSADDDVSMDGVAPTLGDVIGAYKSVVTVQYAQGVKMHGWTPFRNHLWQRNYYEHVIRDEDSLDRIRQYILDNPGRWDEDGYNPNTKKASKGSRARLRTC